MPGKGSDEDRLWDVPEEENGENVGCREVAEDMAGKVGMILLVLFIWMLFS